MIATFIAALIAALIQAVEHWFPWRMVMYQRESPVVKALKHLIPVQITAIDNGLPRIPAYILGVLGMALPLSGLFWYWQSWNELMALWIVIVSSGITVMVVYAIDWLLDRVRRSYESEELSSETTSSMQQ